MWKTHETAAEAGQWRLVNTACRIRGEEPLSPISSRFRQILVGGTALVAATMEGMLLLAGLCLAYEAAITGTILTLTWRRPEIL